jgi:hypothetical protein
MVEPEYGENRLACWPEGVLNFKGTGRCLKGVPWILRFAARTVIDLFAPILAKIIR